MKIDSIRQETFLYIDYREDGIIERLAPLKSDEIEVLYRDDGTRYYQWDAGGITFEDWQILHVVNPSMGGPENTEACRDEVEYKKWWRQLYKMNRTKAASRRRSLYWKKRSTNLYYF